MSASLPFIGFAAVVILAYYARTSASWRQGVLVMANLGFLASFSQGLLSYMPFAMFLLLSYLGLRLVAWNSQRTFLPVLIAILGSFVWLKNYAFVPRASFLPFPYLTIGLSYMLFRILHLVIDTHSRGLSERLGILPYFNYTCNFLTLVSGPIQLYPEYAAQQVPALQSRLTWTVIGESIERIIIGLFKTNVIALVLKTLHGRVLESLTGSQPTSQEMVLGVLTVVLYPLFLYCNFSGYIDIVLGVGRLLGFSLPENFNRPFSADNFIEFWSYRWHISLSSWIRTYVYNPFLLSMLRRFPSRRMMDAWAVIALFVAFFLVGVWHGQTSEFLVYGIVLGLGVAVNKIYQLLMTAQLGRKGYASLAANPIYITFCRGLTFTYFVVTMILFWSNWTQIRELGAVLGAGRGAVVIGVIFIGSTILLYLWNVARSKMIAAAWTSAPLVSQCWRAAYTTALLVVVIVVSLLMNQRAPDIVYKAF